MTYSYDLVIRGGTVVTAAETVSCDIGVRDGMIAALGQDLGNAREILDASGRLVLPGGVDAHCHIDQKSSTGLITADDFYTGGVSAACGGTTTIIPFAAQHRGNSLVQVVRDYEAKAAPKAFVDYAFHLIVSDPTPTVLQQELPQLIHEGHPSLKVYLTYDALRLTDKDVLAVLQVARREGAITMFHAEHHESIAWHIERLLAEGKTAPKWHPYARPESAEREATGRACYLAEVTGAPILIVHVSAGSPLDEIRRARARGVHVLAETCPQYLVFTREDLDLPGFEGAKLMFSPPARDKAAQEALWEGLADGTFDIFSSDHAPYRYDDVQGKKAHGEDAPFTKIPNGVPSLELRLPLLFSEGVKKGRITLERFVALTATNPARTYGMLPRKGTIAVGADADLVLWDPERTQVVTHAILHDRMDYTPFEGMQLTGWPVTTLSRGEVIWHDGEVRGAAGRGRLIHRPAQRAAP